MPSRPRKSRVRCARTFDSESTSAAARCGAGAIDCLGHEIPTWSYQVKAIVYTHHGLSIHDPRSLYETELETPVPGSRDLLVKVRAISVNPIDTKVRASAPTSSPRILGWDAVGIVEAVGESVALFKPGDQVFYAGSIARPGSNAEYCVVDERITGLKPLLINDAQAAALPLSSLTAWELLFDRLAVREDSGQGKSLLIVGAGGGVGSILIQLAAQLTELRVIGTASSPEGSDWLRNLGAHDVIDHSRPLVEQLRAIGLPQVDYVASLTHSDVHYAEVIEALVPQGKLAIIDAPSTLDVVPLKRKSLPLHWESVFARPLFETADLIRQQEILERVAMLADSGMLKATLAERLGRISADNLRRAHALIEGGHTRGKLVLEGF
jgi:zinc-binding alcohol dehydrogenase family protein